jgi:hypothetical protein
VDPKTTEEWTDTTDIKNSEHAFNCLWLLITKSEQQHIQDITEPRKVWTRLQEINESRTPAKRALLKQTLKNITLKDGEDARKYIDKIRSIAIDINNTGGTMDDVDIAEAILEGLPESYSTAKIYLNTQRGDLDTMVHSLLSEEQRQKQEKQSTSTALAARANSNKPSAKKTKETRKCYYCKRKGHLAKDCYKKKAAEDNKKRDEKSSKESSSDDENKKKSGGQLFTIPPAPKNKLNEWFLDSGASNHITKRRDVLFDYEPIEDMPITIGDDSAITAIGKGTLRVILDDGTEAAFSDVLHAPELGGSNLISIRQLTRVSKGTITTSFGIDEATIYREGIAVATITISNDLYRLDI